MMVTFLLRRIKERRQEDNYPTVVQTVPAPSIEPSERVPVVPEDELSEKRDASLRSALDSAVVLAVVTGILFMWGYGYHVGYFGRLSYPTPLPIDAPHRYLAASSMYALFAFAAIAAFVVRALHIGAKEEPRTVLRAAKANWVLLIFPMFMLLLAATGGFLNVPVLTAVGMGVATFIVLTVLSISIFHGFQGKGERPLAFVFLAATAFMLCLVVSGQQGREEAEALIEGRFRKGSVVELEMRNPQSPFAQEIYALVEIREGNYYLIEMVSPAPECPILHIVPQSEAISAQVQRMDDDGVLAALQSDSFDWTPATPVGE